MMRTVVMEQPGSGLPRAFMVRDSYGSALVPHLSGLFSHILYSWRQQLDYPLIEKERPDLFIQLITAFDLARPLPWE